MFDDFGFGKQHVKHLLVKHSTLGCKSLCDLEVLVVDLLGLLEREVFVLSEHIIPLRGCVDDFV